MNINDNVPFIFRQLRPKNMPKKTAEMITRLAQAYGLDNIGEIDEQFLNGFTCASEIVIAQLEKEFESGDKGEWIKVIDSWYEDGIPKEMHWECSKCGSDKSGWGEFKYCPDCGNPKVRGDKAE